MYYLYELARARDAHQIHGGVLLDYGEMYVVCSFEDAVELRCDEIENAQDLAHYWAVMGECGYDESDPTVQRLKARLLGTQSDIVVERAS